MELKLQTLKRNNSNMNAKQPNMNQKSSNMNAKEPNIQLPAWMLDAVWQGATKRLNYKKFTK